MTPDPSILIGWALVALFLALVAWSGVEARKRMVDALSRTTPPVHIRRPLWTARKR